uniref:Uncharacterized protein n=3 Tax=Caenorhabditis tropicalis TaxID=1561998 RepID=A0A1I7UM14_9PELO
MLVIPGMNRIPNEKFLVLLPLLLIFIVVFCCICGLFQVFIFMILLCVRYLIGAGEEEECFRENRNSGSSGSRREEDSSDTRMIGSSQADSTEGSGGNGTPRSRKSMISSPNGTGSV